MIAPKQNALFDSNTHPEQRRGASSFEELARQLQLGEFIGALAVGSRNDPTYSHESFIKKTKENPRLIPIASLDPFSQALSKDISFIKTLGYRGVKVHPRFSGLSLDKDEKLLSNLFQLCADAGLPLFFCTYLHSAISNYPSQDPLYTLVRLIKSAPQLKLVLVHGGDVELLRYVQLARFNPNILIDLSFTILKYENSSLDFDISYLFRTFDERICVGSDFPYYSPVELRRRFDTFISGLALQKSENIGFRNILRFLDCESEFLRSQKTNSRNAKDPIEESAV